MDKAYKFIILSNDTGERIELEQAPEGWNAQKINIIRDLTYLGIIKTISVEFEFVGDGYRFVQRHCLRFGMDANLIFRVYKGNKFQIDGKINYENYDDDRKFKKYRVDIVQSAFTQKFQNREDVKINVLNNISMDRLDIEPVIPINATVRGRQINFFTEFEGSVFTEPVIYHHTLPFKVKVNGNPGVDPANNGQIQIDTNTTLPTTDPPEEFLNPEKAFYVNTLTTEQTLDLEWAIDYTNVKQANGPLPIPPLRFPQPGGEEVEIFPKTRIQLLLVDDNNEVDTVLYTSTVESYYGNRKLSGSNTVVVPVGWYLVFTNEQLLRQTEDGSPLGPDNVLSFTEMMSNTFSVASVDDLGLMTSYTYNNLSMTISQDSVVPDSVHPVILPHELFTNIVQQINGGSFYSEIFGREDLGYDADGEWAYLSICPGTWLRGIPIEETQVQTSMRDAFKSYHSVISLGAIIRETSIQVDTLDKLFNNEIAADIGEVEDLRIGPAKEFMFNSVKAGYPANEYEQENGRDEFNTTYQFTNSFASIKKELDLVSVYCGDGYGVEFARRAGIITTGTSDSRYDDKIFFIDLIKDGTELRSRRTEDITSVSGIFSPETAMNLKIAVGQNMLRHKLFLTIPLDKKPSKTLFFQSKDKNSGLNLVTDLGTTIDGQDIDLGDRAWFLSHSPKFKCPVTVEALAGLLNNTLGRVRYTYEGEAFFDFLFDVNAETDKGVTQWKMLGTKSTPPDTESDPAYGPYLKYDDGIQDFIKYGDGPDDFIKYAD